MTEDKSTDTPPSEEEEVPDAGVTDDAEAEAAAGAEEAGEDSSFLAEAGLPQLETKTGDAPQEELDALAGVATQTEQNFQKVLGHIKIIKDAERTLQRFHAREGNVTPQDVAAAKKRFDEARGSYIVLGNLIRDGIKPVYTLAKTYPDDRLAQKLYITYLAKLLISMETRNPFEPYVRRLAEWPFLFERETVELTPEEEQRGWNLDSKIQEVLEGLWRDITRLEARYQKRLLNTKKYADLSPRGMLKRLQWLARRDPEDLHTHIWMASLLSRELVKVRDQNKRITMRDDVLDYCKRAFSMIDDFLNLQGIQNLSERDKKRADYVKTITAIRKPLISGGAPG